jgi:hypothetical protein
MTMLHLPCSHCGKLSHWDIVQAPKLNVAPLGTVSPITPDPRLIDSMAMRYRHDFGLLEEEEQQFIRITMRQLWEEVVGLGFYKARY